MVQRFNADPGRRFPLLAVFLMGSGGGMAAVGMASMLLSRSQAGSCAKRMPISPRPIQTIVAGAEKSISSSCRCGSRQGVIA